MDPDFVFRLRVIFYQCINFVSKIISSMMSLPRPILFTGRDSSLQLCETIGGYGVCKALLVTDSVLTSLGLPVKVIEKLESVGVSVVVFDGVEPDPKISQVEAGLRLLEDNCCDSVIAFGGGSSLDAAKMIAARATNVTSVEAMTGFYKVRNPCLPLFAIPTTAGTGSEATIGAVISDDQSGQKNLIVDPKLVPQLVALDPLLMLGMPLAVTAATGLDALTHAVESYISRNATAETRTLGLLATRLIFANLEDACIDGSDVDGRQALSLASFYAGCALTGPGLGYAHGIAHCMGAIYHTPHGLANALVLPYILDFSKVECEQDLADLALAAGVGNEDEDISLLAQKFIDAVRDLKSRIGLPAQAEFLQAEDFPRIAKEALQEAHYSYAVPRFMSEKQCEVILEQLKSG
ncbi:MAG: iron-containing alcohol dehydrogenase [Pseudomonadales bacterium]